MKNISAEDQPTNQLLNNLQSRFLYWSNNSFKKSLQKDSHIAKQLPFAETQSRVAIQRFALLKLESQSEVGPSTSGEVGNWSIKKLTSEMMAVEA